MNHLSDIIDKEVLKDAYGKLTLGDNNDNQTVEMYARKDGSEARICFWESISNVDENCFVQRYSVGGCGMDLLVQVINGKMEFGVKCGKDWFSSNNVNDCLRWAEEWFENND